MKSPRFTVQGVTEDALARYLRHRIEVWLREDQRRTASELSRLAGVTPTHISTIRSSSRGTGMKTIRGLARAWGTTVGRLEEEASAWAQENPTPPATRVVYDARYPNLEAAIPFFLAKRGSRAAVELVRGIALKSESDLSPDEWLAELQVTDRRLKAEQRFPVETERREAERQADGEKLDAEVRERVARGETAEPGWREGLQAVRKKREQATSEPKKPRRRN